MAEFGTSSAFRGWVRVRVLGYCSGVRDIKVKSRDCALASDLVRAHLILLCKSEVYHARFPIKLAFIFFVTAHKNPAKSK